MYFKSKKLLAALNIAYSSSFLLGGVETEIDVQNECGQEIVERNAENNCMTIMGQRQTYRYWALVLLFLENKASVSKYPIIEKKEGMKRLAAMIALINEKEKERICNRLRQARKNRKRPSKTLVLHSYRVLQLK